MQELTFHLQFGWRHQKCGKKQNNLELTHVININRSFIFLFTFSLQNLLSLFALDISGCEVLLPEVCDEWCLAFLTDIYMDVGVREWEDLPNILHNQPQHPFLQIEGVIADKLATKIIQLKLIDNISPIIKKWPKGMPLILLI